MRQLTPHRPPKTHAGRPSAGPWGGAGRPSQGPQALGPLPHITAQGDAACWGSCPGLRQPEDCGVPAHFLQNSPRGKSVTASRSPEALRENFPVRGPQKPGNLAASSIAWLYPVFCLKPESPP